MKPTTEINTTIDYRKIGVHLKEARKANSLSQAQCRIFAHKRLRLWKPRTRLATNQSDAPHSALRTAWCRSRKHFGRLHTEARAL